MILKNISIKINEKELITWWFKFKLVYYNIFYLLQIEELLYKLSFIYINIIFLFIIIIIIILFFILKNIEK